MGIFNFFKFFKERFGDKIYRINRSVKGEVYIDVDNLMIDMNGIFHTSAQKIFKYGSCKPPPIYHQLLWKITKEISKKFSEMSAKVSRLSY